MTVPPADRPWHGRGSALLYAVVATLVDLGLRPFLRIRVEGASFLPRHGPVLLTPNHASYLDPVVLMLAARHRGRRLRFVATGEAFEKPVVGWALRHTGQIPVSRGLGTVAGTAAARTALAAGEAVVIYPEGTIPRQGAPPPRAKPGAGFLAMTAGAPVLPVAMWGMQRTGSRYRFGWRRPAAVVFGRPLPPSSFSGPRTPAGFQAASDAILAAVRRLAPVAQGARGRGREPGVT